MESLNFVTNSNRGYHIVANASLDWNGLVTVKMYVSKKKTQRLKEWSYKAGGSNKLYLTHILDCDKYVRLTFTMKHSPSIFCAREACRLVYKSITNLKIE